MRMIFINLLSLSFLLSFFYFFYNIWPRKKIPGLIIVILLSFLATLSILRPGTYESGDLSIHVAGSLSFYNALADGNYIPRWAGDLINGYGTPHHMIMYFLPRYIPALFHLLGIPILISLKLFIFLTFIFSGIGMFLFLRQKFDELPALTGSVFYLYAPYHLIDLHFRVSTGELMAFAVLPFCFYFLSKTISANTRRSFAFFSLSIAVLILSHVAISVVSIPFIFFYPLVIAKKNKLTKLLKTSIGIMSGVALSSFYLIPLILESKYMIFSTFKDLAFYPLREFLFSPYRFGLLFQGPDGDLALIIGYVQLLLLISVGYFIFVNKHKFRNKFDIYFLTSTLFLFFAMLPFSRVFWEIIPVLRGFEFTYRLLLLISLFIAVLAASFATKIINNRKLSNKLYLNYKFSTLIILVIILFTILQTALNWGNRRTIPTIYSDDYFESKISTYLLDFNGTDYATPIWVDTNAAYYRNPREKNIEITGGVGQVRELKRHNNTHNYIINAQSRLIVKENTFYFPGWKLYIDGSEKKIDFKNDKYPGVIFFNLEEGLHLVKLEFDDTNTRKFSNVISIISLIILIIHTKYGHFPKPHRLR